MLDEVITVKNNTLAIINLLTAEAAEQGKLLKFIQIQYDRGESQCLS